MPLRGTTGHRERNQRKSGKRKMRDKMITESIPRTRAETLGQIKAIEAEFATYTGTDYYKSDRADILRQRVIVLDRLLTLLKD